MEEQFKKPNANRTNIILLIIATIFNALWYFIPLAEETGAKSLSEVHYALIPLTSIPLIVLIALVQHTIKKWQLLL